MRRHRGHRRPLRAALTRTTPADLLIDRLERILGQVEHCPPGQAAAQACRAQAIASARAAIREYRHDQ